MHTNRFPGETAAYRAARNALLTAERELRGQVEKVAAMRRALPMGARVPQDYVFEEGGANLDDTTTTRSLKLSELFAHGQDTLVLYGFMFGPKMAKACPMCTCFIDGLNGNATHIARRVSLAVVAKSPLPRLREFARSRGWKNLRLLSSAGSTFNIDYHGEDSDGDQNSIIHVFVKRNDGVHHFYSCELNMLAAEPGQNHRHIDLMWPLWNVLDLTPTGRGTDWFPSLQYGAE
jgi:predicted dithiol-disulfide oxidoreductase (DUF899 family)